jgi:anthranilate phosphoribosyltransferase
MTPTPPLEPFSCAPLIKEIGRGKDGARSLAREQAAALYAALLEGRVSELETGAVMIALRVKGESVDELCGFLDGLAGYHAQCSLVAQQALNALNETSQRTGLPVVVLPSYNGARRKPNFTPLLAGLLAARGYPVLVHGLGTESGTRITSAMVWPHVQWGDVPAPHYLSLQDLNPALARLLNLRNVLGVRNCSHTLVKLWTPPELAHSALITSYTHPEFWHLQREVLSRLGRTALVLRAHEGEPVAAPYRVPRMDAVRDGSTWPLAEPEQVFTEQPDPHPDIDAVATGQLISRWLAAPDLLPHGFVRQVDAFEQLLNAHV